MGGGHEISTTQLDLYFFEKGNDRVWPYDDFQEYYLNDNYFDRLNRDDCFHYVVSCRNKIEKSGALTCGGVAFGNDNIFLLGENICPDWLKANDFIHELGHNIIGSPEINPAASHLTNDYGVGFHDYRKGINCLWNPWYSSDTFCEDCWKAVRLDLCFH
jgi:hypothetical protein